MATLLMILVIIGSTISAALAAKKASLTQQDNGLIFLGVSTFLYILALSAALCTIASGVIGAEEALRIFCTFFYALLQIGATGSFVLIFLGVCNLTIKRFKIKICGVDIEAEKDSNTKGRDKR